MKTKRILNKIIAVSTIAASWIALSANRVQASLVTKANNFANNDGALDMSAVWDKLQPVAQVMLAVAIAVFVGVGFVIGAKFMYKGPDEKAKMKERLIWYIISGVLIFGVVGIFNIVVSVLTQVTA